MSGQVVVDASVAVKWVVQEDDSAQADALRREWANDDVRMYAPRMLLYEVANTLLRKAKDGILSGPEASSLMRSFLQIRIEYVDWPELYPRAIDLAMTLAHPAAYDTLYLVVAEEYGCELWLADGPFYDRALAAGRPVRILGGAP